VYQVVRAKLQAKHLKKGTLMRIRGGFRINVETGDTVTALHLDMVKALELSPP
jgi:hypothetical protein